MPTFLETSFPLVGIGMVTRPNAATMSYALICWRRSRQFQMSTTLFGILVGVCLTALSPCWSSCSVCFLTILCNRMGSTTSMHSGMNGIAVLVTAGIPKKRYVNFCTGHKKKPMNLCAMLVGTMGKMGRLRCTICLRQIPRKVQTWTMRNLKLTVAAKKVVAQKHPQQLLMERLPGKRRSKHSSLARSSRRKSCYVSGTSITT
mmetsp:Transcript_38164/g.73304  ORF Transcript_38164/g.73304 Transcript_38164/m.73304 type:complete len:203 (-) Transcript_38164:690-1298(-)